MYSVKFNDNHYDHVCMHGIRIHKLTMCYNYSVIYRARLVSRCLLMALYHIMLSVN